jgi:myo-inositol 2-dehydrogenase/D-chiro-inositol 1-dehydrogenase
MSDASVTKRMDRRDFITTALGTAGFVIINSRLVKGSSANSALRVGLLGCGKRGTADASHMVEGGAALVVALADPWQSQLERAKEHFDTLNAAQGYPIVDRSQVFAGHNAFEDICGSKGLDIVVIGSPSSFHPLHLNAAIGSGKHVYCETPIAVDPFGAKQVLEISRKTEGKLTVDAGFQLRSGAPFIELMRRIHGGALGVISCGDMSCGPIEDALIRFHAAKDRLDDRSTAPGLPGTVFIDQSVHTVDLCSWALQSHPSRALGHCVRPGPGIVNNDYYRVVFYYPRDVHIGVTIGKSNEGSPDSCVRFFGSKGISELGYSLCAIYGEEPWACEGRSLQLSPSSRRLAGFQRHRNMFADADLEKKRLFLESIREGRFYNQAAAGVESALATMLARHAAYTREEVTWDELLASEAKWDFADSPG